MSDQQIHLSFSIKEIFELIPSLANEVLKYSPLAGEISELYKGTTFTFGIHIDDETYHLIINDGKNFEAGYGDIENAMIRFKVGMKDLQELIVVQNAYMFLGTSYALSASDRSRMSSMAEKLKGLNGTINVALTNANQSVTNFSVCINNAAASKVTIQLAISDFVEMMNKTTNPINMFMAGRLKIEGDMALALQLQSLLF